MLKNFITLSATHRQRLIYTIIFVAGIAAILTLVLFALRQNINLFYTPSQIAAGIAPVNKRIRVGGMIVAGSLQRQTGLTLNFTVTDYAHNLRINYEGILPALFAENQGVVALGKLTEQGYFYAEQILAKHDEKYMPKEVASSLQI